MLLNWNSTNVKDKNYNQIAFHIFFNQFLNKLKAIATLRIDELEQKDLPNQMVSLSNESSFTPHSLQIH